MKRKSRGRIGVFKANPNKVIICQGKRYSLGELSVLLKEQGSLVKVSAVTQIPYNRLYHIFKTNFREGIVKIKKKVGCIQGKIKFSRDIKEIVRLFRKYGFLPYVSQATGIPANKLYQILVNEFGVGLTELRKKLGINRRCLERRDVYKNAARYQQMKEAYERLGSLEKVGKEFNITRERVRQILERGDKCGLFEYEISRERRFKEISQKYNRDSILNEIKISISPPIICQRLGIKDSEFSNLLEYFNIDYKEYRRLAYIGKHMKMYSQIVATLGHHPTTTELQSRTEWRTVWGAIDRYWGNFDNFRKEFGIEKPKHRLSTKFVAHLEAKKLRAENYKKNIVELLRTKGALSAREIAAEVGLSTSNLVNNYLYTFRKDNTIEKVGITSNVKYRLLVNE